MVEQLQHFRPDHAIASTVELGKVTAASQQIPGAAQFIQLHHQVGADQGQAELEFFEGHCRLCPKQHRGCGQEAAGKNRELGAPWAAAETIHRAGKEQEDFRDRDDQCRPPDESVWSPVSSGRRASALATEG